jgi:hypothetical protein
LGFSSSSLGGKYESSLFIVTILVLFESGVELDSLLFDLKSVLLRNDNVCSVENNSTGDWSTTNSSFSKTTYDPNSDKDSSYKTSISNSNSQDSVRTRTNIKSQQNSSVNDETVTRTNSQVNTSRDYDVV